MSNADTAIRDAVESFVEQLRELIRGAALESVQAALNSGGESRLRAARPARATVVALKGDRTNAKRTPDELEALVKKLHAHIVKNPGQRIEKIGASLGVSTKELVLPARKLLSEKRLTTKGQKRATIYFPK